MIKSIKLTKPQWDNLKLKLREDYSLSTVIIRDKMKSVLGCVDRTHTDWAGNRYRTIVCLDFYDKYKRTMFLLKYSEYISKELQDND